MERYLVSARHSKVTNHLSLLKKKKEKGGKIQLIGGFHLAASVTLIVGIAFYNWGVWFLTLGAMLVSILA